MNLAHFCDVSLTAHHDSGMLYYLEDLLSLVSPVDSHSARILESVLFQQLK